MDTNTLKTLNVIAHSALQFGTLYFDVLHRVPIATPIYRAPVLTRPVRERSTCNVLSSIIDELNRFGSLYRTPSRASFPGHSRYVAASPNVPTTQSDLHELNRLARLVELSHDNCSVYPTFTPAHDMEYIPNQKSIRRLLNLGPKTTFVSAFPGTTVPKIVLFSGQPRIDRALYNDLLAAKLSAARSMLGINHTPKGLTSLVVSWINSCLCFTASANQPFFEKTKIEGI